MDWEDCDTYNECYDDDPFDRGSSSRRSQQRNTRNRAGGYGSTRATHSRTHTSRTRFSTSQTRSHSSPYSTRSDYSATSTREEKDFVQNILGWRLSKLKVPLSDVASASPLAPMKHSTTTYYNEFLPLILEEARASLAEGLEAVNSRKRQKFQLTLTKNTVQAKNTGNPTMMVCRGRMPKEDEYSTTMNGLLITAKRGADTLTLLTLASCDPSSNTIKVKFVLASGTFDNKRRFFNENQRWDAWYLNSLVTEERMYKACMKQVIPPCLTNIVTGRMPAIVALPEEGYYDSDDELVLRTDEDYGDGLNYSQREAVHAFTSNNTNIMLLQGPPGTGKTTTINAILQSLSNNGYVETHLVTAPSNKAVQVLAERFLDENSDTPAILIGVEEKVPEHLRPMFLHTFKQDIVNYFEEAASSCAYILNLKLGRNTTYQRAKQSISEKLELIKSNVTSLQKQLEKYGFTSSHRAGSYPSESECNYLTEMADYIIAEVNSFSPNKGGNKKIPPEEINRMREELEDDVQKLKDALTSAQYKISILSSEAVENKLLEVSKFVFCTLSVCGRHQMLEKLGNIATLIVDEAGQTVEAETLIAFQHNPGRVLLVGDTKQLPATVTSQHATEKHYDWSMMWRLAEECQQRTYMLDTQYRMHPAISRWPSQQYYGGQLKTAQNVIDNPCLEDEGILSRARAFYDINSQESQSGHSFQNEQEASYIVTLIKHICELENELDEDEQSSIGIITFYAAQVSCIKKKLDQSNLKNEAVVSTVDGFQGDECDIIILSCVRSRRIGFLDDFRRLNVAITRAKNNLIVLGNAEALKSAYSGRGRASDLKVMIQDLRAHAELHTEDTLKGDLGLPTSKPKPKKGKGKQPASSGNKNKQSRTGSSSSAQTQSKSKGKQAASSARLCKFFAAPNKHCRFDGDCKFKHAKP